MIRPSDIAVCAALLLVGGAGTASEIYKWTDEDGVVHFSDTAPPGDTESVRLYVEDSNPPGYDPLEDPYSIRNQAERTNENWAEFEKAKAERAAERREKEARDREYRRYQAEAYDYYYRPGYWTYPGVVRPSRPRLGLRQLNALEETGLRSPPAYSVNSGEHHARVQQSRKLPIAVARPPRPGKQLQ